MSIETNEFFAAAVHRMKGDLKTAYELLGDATFAASTITARLSAGGPVVLGLGAPDSNVRGDAWSVRALDLISLMTKAGDSGARKCAAVAIDDPDARVRGIAWCLLSTYGCGQDSRIDTSVANEFASRRPRTAEPATWDLQARAMPAMMRGFFGALRMDDVLGQLNKEYIDAHGGPDASTIRRSWRDAVCFFEHYDSGRRLAALRTVAEAGKEAAEASSDIAHLAANDVDSQVRVAAVLSYVAIFRRTRDANALRFLAGLVLDDSQVMLLRFAAYDGLFSVVGALPKERPLRRASPDKLYRLRNSVPPLEWPVDVDWKLVHACASGAGGEK